LVFNEKPFNEKSLLIERFSVRLREGKRVMKMSGGEK
jgi:hypothetical protein